MVRLGHAKESRKRAAKGSALSVASPSEEKGQAEAREGSAGPK